MAKNHQQEVPVAVVDCGMPSHKYFTLGYPEHPALPIYALYEPVLDRFLFVVNCLNTALDLRLLLTSRFVTFVVCLNTADNWQPTLIDNTVCNDWTLGDPARLIHLSEIRQHRILLADHLQPCDLSSQWHLDQEQQWCFVCVFYLKFLQRLSNYFKVINFVCTTDFEHSQPNTQKYLNIKQNIFETLYLGKSAQETDQLITNFLEQDLEIKNLLRVEQDKYV